MASEHQGGGPGAGIRARAVAQAVYGLAALFAVDAFGGGFVVNAMLALWLFERFGLSVAAAGTIFFATGVCAGLLKIAYDLALLRQCRAVRPPEEEAMPEYRA